MTHEAFREKLLDLAYGELSRRDAGKVEEHAAACDACRAELSRIRETRRLVAALPPEAAPERGENVLIAAARERSRLRAPRWQVPRWLLAGSIAAASLVVVGAVSYRILAMRPGPLGRSEHDALLGEATPQPVQPSAPAADANAEPRPKEMRRGPSAGVLAAPSRPATEAPERSRADRGRAAGEKRKGEEASAPAVEYAVPPPPEAEALAAPAPERAEPSQPEPARRAAPASGYARPPPSEQAPPRAAPAAPSRHPDTFSGLAREERESGLLGAEIPPAAEDSAPPSRASAPSAASGAAAPLGAVGAREKAPSIPRQRTMAPSADKPYDLAVPADDVVARWESLRSAGKLRAEVRTFSGCDPDVTRFTESFRRLERDPQGRVVRIEMRGSTEGRPYEAEGFYDAAGVLRVERWRYEGGAVTERRHPASGPAKTQLPARANGARIDAPGVCDR
jgi:hypothetical protein